MVPLPSADFETVVAEKISSLTGNLHGQDCALTSPFSLMPYGQASASFFLVAIALQAGYLHLCLQVV